MPHKNPEASKACYRAKYERKIAAGICVMCRVPQEKAVEGKRYCEQHLQKRRELNRELWSENKAVAQGYHAKWLAKNWETQREKIYEWRRANPDVVAAYDRAKKDKRRGSVGFLTNDEWNAIKSKQRGKCAICKNATKLTIDHIVPASVGGSSYAFNIQGLCLPCNARKRNKMTTGLQHTLFDQLVQNG